MSDKEIAPEENEGKVIPDGHPSLTHAEEEASAEGWKPEAEWDGDPDDWVDAKTFNIKGQMMKRISAQGRQLGSQKEEIEELRKLVRSNNDMTRRIVEKTYQKAVRELKAEKMEAVRDGDTERVMAIEEEVDDLQTQHAEANTAAEDANASADKQAANTPDYANLTPQQRAWVDYVATTDWIKAPGVYDQALAFADQTLNADPSMPIGDFVSELNDYGRRVRAQSRPTPAGPDKPSSAGRQKVSRSKKGFSASDLDEMQTDIGKELVDMGDFKSLDDYAEALGKTGAL